MILISLLAMLTFVSSKVFLGDAANAQYAVLAAGSKTWGNYRHQSDIFHAYHVLVDVYGMKPENIIVFAYDDIAQNKQNPFKGKVFNKPDPKGKGVDVYNGVKIDYKGEDVTSKNFLNVLKGDKEKMAKIGTGRVLESTKDDNVFVYISDHGAVGLFAFPSDILYASDLHDTLISMNQNKQYNKLLFYLEACESGSMFLTLPKNINIYATTASNEKESSYAVYCDTDGIVNGVNMNSCLGDEYSVNWMENSDLKQEGETIGEQFNITKKTTLRSHVTEFGDLSIKQLPISDFQGGNVEKATDERSEFQRLPQKNRISSREVKLFHLVSKYNRTKKLEDLIELAKERQLMKTTDKFFKSFNFLLKVDNESSNYNSSIKSECLKESINVYKAECKNFDEYTLSYVKNINAACNINNVDDVIQVISYLCN